MVDIAQLPFPQFLRSPADVANIYGKDRGKARECGDLELDALECLQAYGARRGLKLCENYVLDYKECMFQAVQVSYPLQILTKQLTHVIFCISSFKELTK